MSEPNTLYYGDNLDILRRYVGDETVDLVYLDPPFKSDQPGDLVLDPFCGCGTTIEAAQKLGRRWLGIDITHLAINLMKQRLRDAFGIDPAVRGKGTAESGGVSAGLGGRASSRAAADGTSASPAVAESAGQYRVGPATYAVIGEPVSTPDAEALAKSDPYQFQWWALGLVGARPVEQRKGADKGIDGKIVFQGDTPGQFASVILSVKAGHATVAHVRDLKGVVEREKAALGVLISMQEPTKPMREEAVTAGFYESSTWGRKYAKLQMLTVAELLAGERIDMPPLHQVGATFRKAPKAKAKPDMGQPDLL